MTYTLDAAQIFTLFFIMLGPLKLLIPFVNATQMMGEKQMQILAVRAAGIASVAMIAGGFFGRALLVNWQVEPEVLMLAGGIVFFMVSLQAVMKDFIAADHHKHSATTVPGPAQIAFPMVVPPHGIAALIVLLAASHDQGRTLEIIGIAFGVMALNLLAMIFARPVIKFIGPTVFHAFFAVLGILLAALALKMMLAALQHIAPLFLLT